MRHPLTMRLIQRIANSDRDVQNFIQGSRPRVKRCASVSPSRYSEIDAFLPADVVQRADMSVVQRRDRFRFALEPLLHLDVLVIPRRKNLDSDCPVQPRVGCFMDFTHSTGPDGRENLIRTEFGSRSTGSPNTAVSRNAGFR